MCHELRNPLHVLKSTLTLLLEDQPPEEVSSARKPHDRVVPASAVSAHSSQRQEMVTDVLAALDRMEATVNDVLDFRKLDAQMFVMAPKPVQLRMLVDSICRSSRPFLKNSVQLGYRVTPKDAVAMVDHRRMFQIIINGLSNAGKFTPEGAVAVDITLVVSDVGQQHIVVTVSNTSYGDGLGDAEALFVPFRGTHKGSAPAASGECRV